MLGLGVNARAKMLGLGLATQPAMLGLGVKARAKMFGLGLATQLTQSLYFVASLTSRGFGIITNG